MVTNKYDFIIIGSGLGGLQSAVYLSDFGFKVLVLEKNQQIGGLTQSYRWKGCDLSTGLHYFGSFNNGDTLHTIFNYMGLTKNITYKKLDNTGFDVFNINGKIFKYASGIDCFRNQLISYFPNEEASIEKYLSEIISVVEAQELYNLKPIRDLSKIDNYLQLNAWEFICSLTKNQELRQVLSALNFVYAGEKDKTPFYMHALISYHFISGAYRISGGTSQIAKILEERIIKNGGQILTGKDVQSITIENNKAESVITKDGNIYSAKNVISNVHPAVTIDLINSSKLSGPYRRRMKKRKNTISSFAIHFKLKPNTFPYRNYNYNYHKNNDVWYASNYDSDLWPEHFFMHSHVPENGNKYTDCISVLTYMKYSEVQKWEELPLKQRGNDYKQFKEEKAQKMIKLLISVFPELEDSISNYTVSTPLTYHDYINTPNGSMYGTLRDYKNPIGSYISHKTKIENLYFTGQNMNLHGMIGVSLSAIVTCSEFIGLENLLDKINEKR